MTNRLDTLVDALECQAERTWQQLEEARSRIRALEAENRSLRARLAAFDPSAPASAENMPASAENMPAEAVAVDEASLPARGETNSAEVGTDKDGTTIEQPQTTLESPAETEQKALLNMPVPDEKKDEARSERQAPAHAENTAPPAGQGGETAPSPQALLKQWYRRYPHTFFKGHTRPLQVGIHEQLAAREPWPGKLIKRALAGYVNLPRYLKSVRAGALRVDLDGQDSEPVTEVDAQHAREQLKLLQARQHEREEQKTSQRMAHKLSELASKHSH